MRRPPNLLFVFADQMWGMDMGCAGNFQVLTPNMDRMASEGTLFVNARADCLVAGLMVAGGRTWTRKVALMR